MKLLSTATIFVLCFLLVIPTTGCTASQAKINTAVTDIANWSPVIAADATALLTDVASFEPADAAQIQSAVALINTDSAALTVACKQYLAAPSSSVLTQIAGLVSQLSTSDSQALIAVLQIKDSASKQIAQGILTTIATAVTILSGYLATVNVSAPVTTSSYADRNALKRELAKAQAQGLVPQGYTLAQAGF
jgi:hypothetical protein